MVDAQIYDTTLDGGGSGGGSVTKENFYPAPDPIEDDPGGNTSEMFLVQDQSTVDQNKSTVQATQKEPQQQRRQARSRTRARRYSQNQQKQAELKQQNKKMKQASGSDAQQAGFGSYGILAALVLIMVFFNFYQNK